MKPYYHALSSAKKHGGVWEDYVEIHQFMDSSKAHFPGHAHRAILHSSFGCFIVEEKFGKVAKNSDGKTYCPRDIAEQHCIEDLGFIPTVQDYLKHIDEQSWFGGPTRKRNKVKFDKSDGNIELKDLAESAEIFRKEEKEKENDKLMYLKTVDKVVD